MPLEMRKQMPAEPNKKIRIGTSGWSVPAQVSERFDKTGTHLQRYALTFNSVEITTSFYKTHAPETYRRWARSVPEDFRFSVKLNRRFTHDQRLDMKNNAMVQALSDTLGGIQALGKKWGTLLVQLPPSLIYEPDQADHFFWLIRHHYVGPVVLEPRHASWSSAEALLKYYEISKVKADPELCPTPHYLSKIGQVYYRLHGVPEVYRSSYTDEVLKNFRDQIQSDLKDTAEVWCIFDNTALFHATTNALQLSQILGSQPSNSSGNKLVFKKTTFTT